MTDRKTGSPRGGSSPEGTDTLTAEKPGKGGGSLVARSSAVTADRADGGLADRGLADRIREGREQLAGQAGEKARGLLTQGLERTADTLINVSKMVGDTAPGIEERLGADYGDYARRAAGAIESAAKTVAAKDPDELIEDTRNFVRNSPGIALAGAAIVGFVVARLLKSGTARDESEED